ncbi:MAG: bifunctional serine/threonine-protein kinase/universal stress protein [Rhizobiaceae bacterium]|nr:bifunctional serine/threonine-protein kinase/universal stress protein [Rhizobiaceae bacterium]
MSRNFEPGMAIDGFELVERLPSGGMASVWKARKPGIDGMVVLKIPFLDPGQDASIIVGYEVEDMIARRLSGKHVPRFHGFGDLRDVPYVAMEFVEGESVASLIGKAPLPFEEVRRIGIETGVALAALHEQKVAHLDLKPENIILAKRGAVLLDFGLAAHAELPDLLGAESDVPMGTAAYISPEQVLGVRNDPASDIFALGCILYQLASGQEPFGWPQTTAGMRRRLFQRPTELRTLNPAIPRWLEQIIEKCMEVDRARRYTDAAQLVHDLRNPDQVRVVERKQQATGIKGFFAGLFGGGEKQAEIRVKRSADTGAGPPVVLAAVDLSEGVDALAEQIRAETGIVLAARRDSRLTCVTVLKTEIIGDQSEVDAEGRSRYVNLLVALKDWAHPLHLADGRASFHVLEAVSPADAILDFAERNQAGHIVMGARASSAMRRHLGSVSTKVVAEAKCSVSVIRVKAIETAARAEEEQEA